MSRSTLLLARRAMLQASLAGLFLLAATSASRAHFLWITAEREADRPVIQAFLAEPPIPEGPGLLKVIRAATYSAGGSNLTPELSTETYRLTLPEPRPSIVDGVCDLGVMSRGGSTFRLYYTGRLQFDPRPADEAETGDALRVRLVASAEGAPRLRVLFQGKPAPKAAIKVYEEEGTTRDMTADEQGEATIPGLAEGKCGIWAKWVDATAGEFDGKAFPETRYYATLTLPSNQTAAETNSARAANVSRLAPLPEAINSFGGAVLGDALYVYSGHAGTMHRYHTGTTSPHFRRLNLNEGKTWEELPVGPALQGVPLVAHGRSLYRTGGMAAHNQPGEPADLRSVATFARFDVDTNTWTDLTPLPEPRSTHDAVLVGNYLYVVGGWNLPGGEASNGTWCDSALRIDLTQSNASWEALPEPPFRRRALAAASIDGKVFVLGGLTEDGKVEKRVDIYDPETSTWATGPELPGLQLQGFAPSAFGVDNRLYVSGIEGQVYRLSTDLQSWEPVAKLAIPRITHRLLPGPNGSLLAVAGTFAGTSVTSIESITPDAATAPSQTVVSWEVESATPAVQAQAVVVHGAKILAVGGNRSASPHAFEPVNLVADAVRIGLGGGPAEAAPALPAPRQSAEIVLFGEGRKAAPYLIGGLGTDDSGEVRSLGYVDRFDSAANSWIREPATLPDARAMFGAVVHDRAIWVFGGQQVDPARGHDAPAMPLEVLRWEPGSVGSTFETTSHQLPRPRRSFAGALIGSKYYLVGGLGADGKLVDVVDVFDFETGSWSEAPAPSNLRVFADLAALEGRLYLAGGFSRAAEGERFAPNATVEVFDPSTSRWSTLMEEAPVPAAGLRLRAAHSRLIFYSTDREQAGKAHVAIVAP